MDKNKKSNEGEMGSGDSDDEFYNVKLPYTPELAPDKYAKKIEVKKVYSPPRTKVQYDYKFDSSSDEESESKSSRRDSKGNRETFERRVSEKGSEKKEDSSQENKNLPQSTFKVVEKINEELKNMKNSGSKATAEKTENSSHNHAVTTVQSAVNVPRPQIGMVPPVVVVPPPMVVQQASVMNMGPMIVPSPMGMAGQNVMTGAMGMMQSQNMMGISGGLLRGPTPMGGLMATPNSTMMGMNTVSGMMGMQGNIMGIPGQGSVMGLQGGMINPAAMGGINMGMAGNMMRMAGPNNMIGISRPNSNIVGMPLNIPAPPGNLMGMQVNRGNVMSNPMMGSAGGLMLMGGMLANPGSMMNNSVASTNQSNNPANIVGSSNLVQMANNSQGNLPPRAVPPPFMNVKGKPSLPGNFRWQANAKVPGNMPKTGSPTSTKGLSSPVPSPSSPGDRENDGDEFSRDDRDKSPSLETDESQSPPREIPNTFKNDGSFMEMFKKMREESNQEGNSSSDKTVGNSETKDSSSTLKKPSVMLSGIVGKRRGGRVLKTGLVKKVKKESDADEEKEPKDAWAMYMAEVKKYREASCEEEGKTRPLVK